MNIIGKKASFDQLLKVILPLIALLIIIGLIMYFNGKAGDAANQTGTFLDLILGK